MIKSVRHLLIVGSSLRAALAGLFFFYIPSGFAQPFSLSQVLDHSLQKSYRTSIIEAGLDFAVAEATETSNLANPIVDFDFSVPASNHRDNESEVQVSLSQKIRLGDFGQRRNLAELIERTANSERQLALTSFAREVANSYGRLWKVRSLEEHLIRLGKLTDDLLDSLEKAVNIGQGSDLEIRLIQVEQSRINSELKFVSAEIDLASYDLFSISGIKVDRKDELLKPNLAPVVTENEIVDQLFGQPSPTLISTLKEEIAKARLNLERKERSFYLEPRVSFEKKEDGSNFFGVGVSFPLSINDRNEANLIRANADLKAKQKEREFYDSTETKESIRLLVRRAIKLEERAKIFETNILSNFEKAIKGAQEQAILGQATFQFAWQLQRDYFNAIKEAVEARQQALEARTAIWLVTGAFEK